MGKMKFLVYALIAVAIVGGSGMFLLKEEIVGSADEKPTTAEELVELSVDTDIITTNLASENHFAVVQFNILLNNTHAKEETEKRKAEVRAAIISTIAGFTKEELIGKDGIANLEQQLASKVESFVETGTVERVLVTEFKVQ